MKTGSIIELVASFCVRQIAKYGAENVNWEKVHTDLDIRVNKLVPGDFLDPFACALVGKIVDLVEDLCKDPKALEEIKAAIESKKLANIITAISNHCKKQLVE